MRLLNQGRRTLYNGERRIILRSKFRHLSLIQLSFVLRDLITAMRGHLQRSVLRRMGRVSSPLCNPA
jgi:hypothetical protein